MMQSVRAGAPFSRYSAPPTAGVLVKSGPANRPVDKITMMCIPCTSQHATAVVSSSSSSSSSAVVKPGQSLPLSARPLPPGQSSVSAKSTVGGGSCTAAVTSSATVGRSSPTVTSQHVRSNTLYAWAAKEHIRGLFHSTVEPAVGVQKHAG